MSQFKPLAEHHLSFNETEGARQCYFTQRGIEQPDSVNLSHAIDVHILALRPQVPLELAIDTFQQMVSTFSFLITALLKAVTERPSSVLHRTRSPSGDALQEGCGCASCPRRAFRRYTGTGLGENASRCIRSDILELKWNISRPRICNQMLEIDSY